MKFKHNGVNRRDIGAILSGAAIAMVAAAPAKAAIPALLRDLRGGLRRRIATDSEIQATSAEDYIRQFLIKSFPDLPGNIGDDTVTAFSNAAIPCCQQLRISEWSDMGWFAFLGIVLGLYFYRDPQWHELPSVMSNLNEPANTRLGEAFDLMRANITTIAGENYSYIKKAYLLLVFYQVTDETADLAQSEDACLDELAKLWQQKADLIRSVKDRYFAAARNEARNSGLTGELDGALFGFIGAFAGLGFYNDPVCSWMRDIIDKHRNDTSKQRFVLSLQEIQRTGVRRKLFG